MQLSCRLYGMIPGILDPIIDGWNLRIRIDISNLKDMCDTSQIPMDL